MFTLDPEFTADLFEQRDSATGAPTFGLWMESMAVFDYGNYQIDGTVSVGAGTVSIHLEEIGQPVVGQGAPGPAHGFLPIGPLADGEYRFTISRNIPIANAGMLSVQNGHYTLIIDKEQDIIFRNRVLESLPEGYVWGYALAPAEPDLPVADQFISDLKPLTAAPDLPAGYYSYFTISGTGQYFFHPSVAPSGQHRPFLRRLNNSPDAIRALLQQFRAHPDRPLEIRCMSTSGAL